MVPQVADTDYGGGIYHGKYFALYNQARDTFLEDLGVSYLSLMQQEMNLSVAELRCIYKKPVFYGDRIEVRTRVSWIGRKSLGVIQEMMGTPPGKDDIRLRNRAELNLVCTSNGRAVPLPRELVEAIYGYYGMDKKS